MTCGGHVSKVSVTCGGHEAPALISKVSVTCGGHEAPALISTVPALISANPPVSSHKVGIALSLCDSTANVTHQARCLVVGPSTWR